MFTFLIDFQVLCCLLINTNTSHNNFNGKFFRTPFCSIIINTLADIFNWVPPRQCWVPAKWINVSQLSISVRIDFSLSHQYTWWYHWWHWHAVGFALDICAGTCCSEIIFQGKTQWLILVIEPFEILVKVVLFKLLLVNFNQNSMFIYLDFLLFN